MATDPLRQPPPPKRSMRDLPCTMDHDLRGVVGLRHITTISTMRQVKDKKKEVVGEYTARLDSLDLEAKGLELASAAKDGEEVELPTPVLETAVFQDKVWKLKVERIERDPNTGEEYRTFLSYEDLPEELAYLNQGTLFDDDKKPPKDGGGGRAEDAVKGVDFPEEGDGEEKKPATPPKAKAPKKGGGKGKKPGAGK
jgi:hypothetical protein